MKILFLANHFITLYSFRKELISDLCKKGYEVYLSIPQDDNNYFQKLGCKIINTKIDRRGVNPVKDIGLIKQYVKIMSTIKPDIIFSYTIKPNIYGSMVSNLLKYRQICNITGTGGTFLNKSIISELIKILYKFSVKKFYKVFFKNNGDKDYFVENKMVGKNWETIPGSGCNIEDHTYIEMPSDEITQFIFIGRVMELKGIDEYLDCAKTIREKNQNTRFLVAGWNEEKKYKEILEKYEADGYIEYIGFRNDINDWIAKSHCTILPSHGGEGVPNVLLETSAIGRACIGSKINGTSEVISDGITGYLFETGNAEDLIKQVDKFLHLSYEQKSVMGIEGRKRIESKFNRQIVIDKYLDEVNAIK